MKYIKRSEELEEKQQRIVAALEKLYAYTPNGNLAKDISEVIAIVERELRSKDETD